MEPERGLLASTVAVATHYDDDHLTDHHEDIRINQNSLSPLSECNCNGHCVGVYGSVGRTSPMSIFYEQA